MGYIPPLRDEQTMIYGSRQSYPSPLIKGPDPAERVEFFEALKQHSKQGKYFERNESKERLLMIAKQHENKFVGKGEKFDQSI
ncbi:hypothetical protein CR203_10230 [Salipaludibacillus neizhouensis]|uniref:Uncharacterized protein n=1 Tax=Salipaludibacillus neizhouensis TaxID=885475 RepID=A0A3A9K3R4_9BACI|nr:hypothetical protein [Salipaludibacillus neizhouensis]RKL67714.1 hypothetical protein CR203_10230 [Salipaludibacillus neizhouensis]